VIILGKCLQSFDIVSRTVLQKCVIPRRDHVKQTVWQIAIRHGNLQLVLGIIGWVDFDSR